MYSNEQIAQAFDNLASIIEFLDSKDPADPFRIRTYRKVANIIRGYPHNIYELRKEGKLEQIPGLGKQSRTKLLQFLETWKIKKYEELKQNIPESVLQLMEIPGIWPKLAKQLFQELNIKSPQELQQIIEKQPEKILSLPRMWEWKLEQIKKWLQMYQFTQTRTPLGIVYPYIQQLKNWLANLPEVENVEIAGSTRRMKETVWDIDILAVSKNPLKTMEDFINYENVENVLASGPTKTSVFLKQPHIQVDLRIVPKEDFGAALQYFTWSKQHNIHLRTIAKEKWYKISEYGIFKVKSEEVLKKSEENNNYQPQSSDNLPNESSEISYIKVWWEKEEDIYHTLGMDRIPPELREDQWEIQAALEHNLPNLIDYNDLKWDLHIHSNRSDGQNSIEELVQTAIKMGYNYIAITDHSKSLAVANWLDETRFKQRYEEILKLRKKYPQIEILVGTECDILSDGNLDYPDEILSMCDVVIGSIHMWFSGDQTERYLKALDNPYLMILWHPTDRILWQREELKVDWDKVFAKALEKWVIMEINSQPLRLDLPVPLIKKRKQLGGKFVINTDAHSILQLQEYSKYWIGQARRGWVEKKDVMNTLDKLSIVNG